MNPKISNHICPALLQTVRVLSCYIAQGIAPYFCISKMCPYFKREVGDLRVCANEIYIYFRG